MPLFGTDNPARRRLCRKVPSGTRISCHASGTAAALHFGFDFLFNCDDFIRRYQFLSPPCSRYRSPSRTVIILHNIAVSTVHPQQACVIRRGGLPYIATCCRHLGLRDFTVVIQGCNAALCAFLGCWNCSGLFCCDTVRIVFIC